MAGGPAPGTREVDVAEPVVPVVGERASGKLAELYEASAPRAVRLAYLLTGDRTVAEDIAQDAFVRVAGRLAHLRAPHAFDAYLRSAVVNLSKNHFRRRAIERGYLQRQRAPHPVAGPETGVADRHAVMAALAALPPKQRAAIVLRYYEDQPEGAIADILRCRPATVRSLVARGMASMRDVLGADLVDGEEAHRV
ncbi:MAG TPA: SigE family RNA polymerase sigma factor [Actinomycetota bacterium]|nr:SigE family RNA polymerase sigma factor [Actinomycetota bacterium]